MDDKWMYINKIIPPVDLNRSRIMNNKLKPSLLALRYRKLGLRKLVLSL